jgi:hypothetical protein
MTRVGSPRNGLWTGHAAAGDTQVAATTEENRTYCSKLVGSGRATPTETAKRQMETR